MDIHFLHFSTSPPVKRVAPKGKQMRIDHPFILDFCQNVTFYIVFTMIFHFFGKFNFLKLLSFVYHFVYLRFKNGRPHIIIIIISKTKSYFKIRTLPQRYDKRSPGGRGAYPLYPPSIPLPPTPAEPPRQHPHCKAELKLSDLLCRAKAARLYLNSL